MIIRGIYDLESALQPTMPQYVEKKCHTHKEDGKCKKVGGGEEHVESEECREGQEKEESREGGVRSE